jgi:TRAP-type C4-dicarboxylate transport system permease small subunit
MNKLVNAARSFEAGLKQANRILVYLAALAMFGMMMLTVVDVGGRYFFSSPVLGTWEMVSFLLVGASTLSIGYCQITKGHISVDFILERFPPRVKAVIRTFAYLVGLAAFSLLAWQVFVLAQHYLSATRGNATDTLGIPLFPFVLAMAIGCGVMALVLLVDVVHSIAEVRRK